MHKRFIFFRSILVSSSKDLSKTALGSENAVDWQQNDNPIEMARMIKKDKDIKLVLLEHTYNSKSLYDQDWDFPMCIVFDNEVILVSGELIEMCDLHVEIPMRGIKQSLNVATAAGIIGYEVFKILYLQYKTGVIMIKNIYLAFY